MATAINNLSAVLDAFADYKGKTLTNQQKLDWAERFIDEIGGPNDNETKANTALNTLVNFFVATGSSHVKLQAERDQAAANEAAADTVRGEFE